MRGQLKKEVMDRGRLTQLVLASSTCICTDTEVECEINTDAALSCRRQLGHYNQCTLLLSFHDM